MPEKRWITVDERSGEKELRDVVSGMELIGQELAEGNRRYLAAHPWLARQKEPEPIPSGPDWLSTEPIQTKLRLRSLWSHPPGLHSLCMAVLPLHHAPELEGVVEAESLYQDAGDGCLVLGECFIDSDEKYRPPQAVRLSDVARLTQEYSKAQRIRSLRANPEAVHGILERLGRLEKNGAAK